MVNKIKKKIIISSNKKISDKSFEGVDRGTPGNQRSSFSLGEEELS